MLYYSHKRNIEKHQLQFLFSNSFLFEMGIKSELKTIDNRLNQLKETNRSFRDIFKSIFFEKNKIMFTVYGDKTKCDFSYGDIEKSIYAAYFTIIEKTKGENRDSWIAVNAESKVTWVIAFWACLLAGYKAFLFNPSHTKEVNDGNIKNLDVHYVIGDTAIDGLIFISLKDLKDSKEEVDYSFFANEIALSSSGSSSISKIAVYSGQKVFENIVNYNYVINKDIDFINHRGPQHSQLVILPFYHIFGFTLVFMWYSFSNSRFVLPKDLTAQSMMPIFKNDEINMILSVPLFFELISDRLYKVAKEQRKEKKLQSLLDFNNRLQEKHPRFGSWFVKHFTAKSLRKKTFGTSLSILGIGGAKISNAALRTFNGLGYRAVNGYGTTELSIFLAAYGCNIKALNAGTIGNDPWRGQYKFGENGELSLCVPTCADYILENGEKRVLDASTFIPTGDIGHEDNGYLFIDAREDDLLVLPNGEKVYPNNIESYFEFIGCNKYRILNHNRKLVLVVYCDKNLRKEELFTLYSDIKKANKSIPSALRVQEIRKTSEPLPLSLKQEVSRLALSHLLKEHPENYQFMSLVDAKANDSTSVNPEIILFIKKEVANILHIDDFNSISDNDDFFTDLGGDSISFMELYSRLSGKGSFSADKALAMSMTSIKEIAIQFKTDSTSKGKEENT